MSRGTLLFAGGGTGGHVFPMLAVADAVRAIVPDVEIVFVGTERGLETTLVPARGYRLELLSVAPMRGGGASQLFRGAMTAARAALAARRLVRDLAPRAVFSIGGYAAGPSTLAARTLGIPVALVEPNAEIGLANRLVARIVQRAYTAFPESDASFPPGTVRRTGVPLRDGFRPSESRADGSLHVLVLGGSQGAVSLNESVPRALASAGVPLVVVHQCGAGKDARARALYAELGAADVTVVPFIDDMPRALADADVVIGRAGAGAVAEICAVGRASILVPYPFAGDHQRHNAASLARQGAAVCLLASDATVPNLRHEVRKLAVDRAELARMAAAARALGRPDAARVIAEDFVALAGIGGSGKPDGDVGTRPASPRGSGALAARSHAEGRA